MSAEPQAVWYRLTVKVSVGSRKDTLGCIQGYPRPSFSLVSKLVMTPPLSISEPVAARVSTVTRGRARSGAAAPVEKSQGSPS